LHGAIHGRKRPFDWVVPSLLRHEALQDLVVVALVVAIVVIAALVAVGADGVSSAERGRHLSFSCVSQRSVASRLFVCFV
jgi:hypothetical protein